MFESSGDVLRGQRVLVTRTQEQAGAFSTVLREAGFGPVELPMIRICDPLDWKAVDQALTRIHNGNWYDWVICTSVNVVKHAFRRMQMLGYAPTDLNNVKIATVGPQTALELKHAGVHVELVPDHYALTDLVDSFRARNTLEGKKILLLRPVGGRPTVVEEMIRSGASVDEIATHRALPSSPDTPESRAVVEMMRRGELQAVTFTGSSTVHHFVSWLTQAAPEMLQFFRETNAPVKRPLFASIGPVTADTLLEYGLPKDIVAKEYTIEGLTLALEVALSPKRNPL